MVLKGKKRLKVINVIKKLDGDYEVFMYLVRVFWRF